MLVGALRDTAVVTSIREYVNALSARLFESPPALNADVRAALRDAGVSDETVSAIGAFLAVAGRISRGAASWWIADFGAPATP
jgi:hypothetical protein